MAKKSKADSQPNLFEDDEATDVESATPPPGFPTDWAAVLGEEFSKPYFVKLMAFVTAERATNEIFPSEDDVFRAFHTTPLSSIRVVILGQDPYPTPGHAHGLAFSVRPGVAVPASLRNMYKELESDLGHKPVKHGSLVSWAMQGVFLLNSVLTVQSGKPASHAKQGWELFTDAVLRKISERDTPVVFLLWGAYAQKKASLIDTARHRVLTGVHPSPLSASNGFFGSKPYSRANTALQEFGLSPIDWKLPDQAEVA